MAAWPLRVRRVLILVSQAEALSERASALEQRALFLSCAEADELEHAANVLGQPVGGAGPHQPSPHEQAGATRKRGSKRKQASSDTKTAAGHGAAMGFTPDVDRA